MDESHREAFRAAWQQLATRNSWMLVADEEAFLDQAHVEFTNLKSDGVLAGRIRLALERTYSVELYAGLRRKEDRAAQELWLAFRRLALKNGWPPDEAEEVAQETVFRAYIRLHTVQSPQGLLYWALTVFRSVQRDMRARTARTTALEPDADVAQPELVAADDVAATVEERAVSAEIDTLLQEAIPNKRQRIVFVRNVIFDDDLVDIARTLAIPPHRVRQDKFRVIERLKNDEQLLQRLREILGRNDNEPRTAS